MCNFVNVYTIRYCVHALIHITQCNKSHIAQTMATAVSGTMYPWLFLPTISGFSFSFLFLYYLSFTDSMRWTKLASIFHHLSSACKKIYCHTVSTVIWYTHCWDATIFPTYFRLYHVLTVMVYNTNLHFSSYLQAGHCTANRAHKTINFFAGNFAKCSTIWKFLSL